MMRVSIMMGERDTEGEREWDVGVVSYGEKVIVEAVGGVEVDVVVVRWDVVAWRVNSYSS